jgi:hypothetical protein
MPVFDPKSMKKITTLLPVLAGLLQLTLQNARADHLKSITGTVADVRTGKSVPGVNVFLSKTTVGTVTDSLGRYAIDHAPPGVFDLVFQHVGYEIKTETVSLADSGALRIDVRLQPKVLKGPEIKVTGPFPKEWRRRYEEFEKAFLGETGNARKCSIRNPDAVQFRADSEGGSWTAFSDHALIVENRALGYVIRNHIIDFSWSPGVVIVRQKVFSMFKPMTPHDGADQRRIAKNRESGYRGSIKHFVSAFARRKIKEEGFRVYESRVNLAEGSRHPLEEISNRYPIPLDNLYQVLQCSDHADAGSPFRRGAVLKNLSFKGWLKVEYGGVKSFIMLGNRFMVADTLGNIWSPVSYTAAGAWGRCGIADLLPSDYNPP